MYKYSCYWRGEVSTKRIQPKALADAVAALGAEQAQVKAAAVWGV